jgi:branched-chain amino acid transport system substrate-binding protein
VARTGGKPHVRLGGALTALLLAFVVAACGSDDDGSGGDTTVAGAPNTGVQETSAPPDTATPDTASPDTATPDTATPDTATPDTATPDTATPGSDVVAADDSLEPITIGLVNQQGGSIDQSPGYYGFDAAVRWINAELGGIDGHPLEVEFCPVVATAEDALACGQQIVNNDAISLAAVLVVATGEEGMVNVLTQGGLAVTTFTATYAAGNNDPNLMMPTPGSPGISAGQAHYIINELKAQKVAFMYSDNTGSTQLATVTRQLLVDAGLEAEMFPVPSGATDVSTVIASVIQSQPDAMMFSLEAGTLVPALKAYNEAEADFPLVASWNSPSDKAVLDAIGGIEAANGFVMIGLGYVPLTEGMGEEADLMRRVDAQFSQKPGNLGGTFSPGFSLAMMVQDVLESALEAADGDVSQLSRELVKEELFAFDGPVFNGAQVVSCPGPEGKVSVCANEIFITKILDGKAVPSGTLIVP